MAGETGYHGVMDDRFWDLVDKTAGPDGCWLWTRAKNEHGYGIVRREGRNHRAHRWAWHLSTGKNLDPEVKIRHRCDNPPCVNPAHLEPGSQAQNMGDAVSRKRNKRGRMDPNAKLTDRDAALIFELSKTFPYRSIAEHFGVSQTVVHRVATRKGWKHVEPNAVSEAATIQLEPRLPPAGHFSHATQCVHGHPFTPENTIMKPNAKVRGGFERVCATCRTRRNKELAARRKALRHERKAS